MSTTKTNASNQTEEKKGNVIIESINSLVIAFGRFLKSSYLSITFLTIILILVQALDQANTLLIDMVEVDKGSLVFCFILISFFAAILSHYPLYIYYSKDINGSKDDHLWYAYKLWFKYYVFTYKRIETKEYHQDYIAKFLRQAMGLVIFGIWHYYIYQAFYPKLVTALDGAMTTKVMTIILAVIPVFVLIGLLIKLSSFQKKHKNIQTASAKKEIYDKRVKFTKNGSRILLIMIAVVVLAAVFTLFKLEFNYYGYWLLQIMTFLLAILYILFRVFRVYVQSLKFTYKYKFNHISNNVGFLRFYLIFTVLVILFIAYSNIAAYNNFWLANAMLILLSCFFVIYYILATSLKYYFVLSIFEKQDEVLTKLKTKNKYLTKTGLINSDNEKKLLPLIKQEQFSKKRRRVASVFTVLFFIMCIVSLFVEKRIHELEVFKSKDEIASVKMKDFKAKLLDSSRVNKPMLFVAAQGGGLKANIWTMKVLNQVQKQSKGQFLNQTVSFSGASGGMMGLSLYSVLSGIYKTDYDSISVKINKVAKENFASRDIALTFGVDFVRKFVPFHKFGTYRDRSYSAMLRYQNVLENKTSKTLDTTSFKTYWKDNIYDKNEYFPSLIVNTAKTNGRRGVFYSIDYKTEGKIFSNSDKLSQLDKGYIAFYEAVSSTNRFPALSPAAKIKGYGHYIDAGAIDNSGLLSSIDLYTYFQKDSKFDNRQKVFVEILNGKNNYLWYLLQKFKKEKNEVHIIINEKEQDNIIADIKTGLNLDKIPNYLSDLLEGMKEDPCLNYQPIYLPFHIEMDDVEDFLGGELLNENQIKKLDSFLKVENRKLKIDLNENEGSWVTYEPTLARHLSQSTINYYNKVLQGQIIENQIDTLFTKIEYKTIK